MKYIELLLMPTPFSDIIKDVITFQLAEIGYNTFIDIEKGLATYIPEKDFSEIKIQNLFNNLLIDTKVSYKINVIEDKNWNKEWEKKYFKPLVIDNQCMIRSTFHKVEKEYKYEIVIDPKMAFGTGHHQTTFLMIQKMLKQNFINKTVLDMGCGTAVLAILASKTGASDVIAIDYDEWAYENAKENIYLNHIDNIRVKHGTVELIEGKQFDVILANINRNILLQDIQHYEKTLKKDGILIMSGFYNSDVKAISEECEKYDLLITDIEEKDDWVAVVCQRQSTHGM